MTDAASQKADELKLRDAQAHEIDEICRKKGALYAAVEWGFTERSLQLKKTDVLFDAGCGTGRLTVRMAPFVARVVACDFSANSLAVLEDRRKKAGASNIETHQLDLTKRLPFPDQSFDKIHNNAVLPYIHPEYQKLLLDEWYRVLKPGGVVAISMLYRLGGPMAREGREGYIAGPGGQLYRYAFDEDDLQQKLAASGFKDIRIEGLMAAYNRPGNLLSQVGLGAWFDRVSAKVRTTSVYLGAVAVR